MKSLLVGLLMLIATTASATETKKMAVCPGPRGAYPVEVTFFDEDDNDKAERVIYKPILAGMPSSAYVEALFTNQGNLIKIILHKGLGKSVEVDAETAKEEYPTPCAALLEVLLSSM